MTRTPFSPHRASRLDNIRPINTRPINTRLRPLAVATHLAIGSLFVAGTALGLPATAYAQAGKSYTIPAGPLGPALTKFAAEAGVVLSFDPTAVAGKSTQGLKGSYAVEEGLDTLLAGSGYRIGKTAAGYTLVAAPEPSATGEAMLPVVKVKAEADSGGLPAAYAGGQVAKGARIKMLGNADVMTTPFSVKSYTNELIMNQGARSVDDVVANDPSIRVALSPGFVLDQSSIRGFNIGSSSYTIDGLPGVVSYSRIAVQNFERVEIFKGPTSALGGASVSGTTVGGSVNLVSKRAMATPNASVSAGVSSDSMFDTHVDVGRRFGDKQEWGVRLNLYGETGEMSTGTKRDNLAPQIALDYMGEKFRATLDAGLVDYKNRKPGVNHSLGAGQTLPAAPNGGRAAQPDVAQQALDGHWSIVGAEYDLLPQLTAFAKYGKYYEESVDSFLASIGALRSDGTFTVSNYGYNSWKTDQNTKEIGLRGDFETGPVKHQASLSALNFYRLYTAASGVQTTVINATSVTGNIYSDYATPYTNVRPSLGAYTGTAINQDSLAIADSMTMLDDKLNVIVGLRRQNIKQDAVAPAVPYDTTKTTPTLAASYQLGGGLTVYGNYAEQLSQGGVAPTGTANAGQSLEPYVGKQNELGVKWNAGSYGVTLAYFDIKQASAFTDPADNTFKAAGEQRNKGLELETFGEVSKGVRLLGGIAYIDAKQTKTLLGATDGKRALGVAEVNLNLGAELDVGAIPGLTLTSRVIHTGEAYVNLTNTQKLPAWTRLDMGARYLTRVNGKAVTLRAGINNVMDKAYWMSGGRNLFVVAEPRTYRVSASFDF